MCEYVLNRHHGIMGDSNFERLINKMKNVLLLELETQLYELKYQKQIKELI